MRNIQMVDLQAQYKGIADEVKKSIEEIIGKCQFINGPQVHEFAKVLAKYCTVDHVIPCANGTDALQIALMALNLEAGDEVIAPGFTFIASVEVIALLKLTPVIADVRPDTFNIDTDHVKRLITPRTKAIMPVHLFGQCSDMETIMAIAREHDLFVVEDNAQSIGAEYTFSDGRKAMAGSIGEIGTTSFYPSKNLGAYGDAGAVMTNDDALAAVMQSIVNHGMSVRYYHDKIGVNSRLDTFQAAVLLAKLHKLDQYNKARQAAAAFYDQELRKIDPLTIPARDPKSTHVFHQYTLQVAEGKRDALKEHLQSKGIPTMIYYPVPTQQQKAFIGHLKNGDDVFPVTDRLCKTVLSLPMHSELDEEQLHYITTAIQEFF